MNFPLSEQLFFLFGVRRSYFGSEQIFFVMRDNDGMNRIRSKRPPTIVSIVKCVSKSNPILMKSIPVVLKWMNSLSNFFFFIYTKYPPSPFNYFDVLHRWVANFFLHTSLQWQLNNHHMSVYYLLLLSLCCRRRTL